MIKEYSVFSKIWTFFILKVYSHIGTHILKVEKGSINTNMLNGGKKLKTISPSLNYNE